MNSGRKRLGNTNGSRDHSDVSKPKFEDLVFPNF